MSKLYVLSCLLTMILPNKGFLLLDEVRKELFYNTSKVWQNYVIKFLDVAIHKVVCRTGIRDWLQYNLELSTTFINFSNQLHVNRVNKSIITRATGQFFLNSSEPIKLRDVVKNYLLYPWNFYIDKVLGLNVTFFNIYFSSGPKPCTAGKVSCIQRTCQG